MFEDLVLTRRGQPGLWPYGVGFTARFRYEAARIELG